MNLRFFPIPYMRRTLHVPLSPPAFVARLHDAVIPREHWWESSVAVKGNFEGRVNAEGFAITRVLGYRNSFAPTLYGKFEADSQGTRLTLTLRMNPVVIVFLLAWCSVISWATVVSLASCFHSRHWEAGAFIPAVMLLGCYLAVSVGYSIEARKALRFLHNLVNGVAQPE